MVIIIVIVQYINVVYEIIIHSHIYITVGIAYIYIQYSCNIYKSWCITQPLHMTQYNVNKYHIWYVYSCSIYCIVCIIITIMIISVCYSLCYMCVCTCSKAPTPTYPRTDKLAGQSKRRQCSVHIPCDTQHIIT